MQRILFAFFTVLLLSCALAQGQIVYVSRGGTGNGSSWAQAGNLTDAVKNAPPGAQIWLKQGVYEITETLDLSGYEQAGIGLYGGFDGTETSLGQRNYEANETILDGLGERRIINIDVTDITADGLTFRNGFVAGEYEGGGAISIFDSGTTIRNCIFRNNISEGSRGAGAIYNRSGSGLLINNCLFEDNKTQNYAGDANGGGAIHNWADEVTITNTIFRNNSSHNSGGALYTWYDDPIHIENCVFEGNKSAGWGGAIDTRSQLTISNTDFAGNQSAGNGGAIYNGKSVVLSNANFAGNTSGADGGAIFVNYSATVSVTNTLFDNNQASDKGGAVFNNGGVKIANATFADNQNHAVVFNTNTFDYLHVYNSIFHNNTSPNGSFPDISPSGGYDDGLDLDIRRNMLQVAPNPAYSANNQAGADPKFVDAAAGDYTLQSSSPAIDAGRNALFNNVSATSAATSSDLGGNPRVQGASIDMGAYELDPSTVTIPNCTVVTAPSDGAADVPLDAAITWTAAADATGYHVFIGTTPGGTEVVNGEQVTGTSFQPAANFAGNTTYYVRVTPYNSAGSAVGCSEISFRTETLLVAPECTTITSPSDGAGDVPLDAAITWTAAGGATGYRVFIGTTPGGTEVVNGEQVTGTSFNVPGDYAENTTYYVRVVPYNSAGSATGCSEISFTTETLLTAPGCTTVTGPADGATDVPLDAAITWAATADATGYRVFIGTTPGGTEVVNGEKVTGTSFQLAASFAENTTYYVRVAPYNAAGPATGCTEISFTTETLLTAPGCTTVTGPADGATDVPLDAAITWAAANGATGYRIFIGTTPGGTEVVNGGEVTGTSFQPPASFAENTTYYVRVVPYNAAGSATGCAEISFTTETLLTAPGCTTVTSPSDGAGDVPLDATITWTAAADATGYRVFIGTTPGGTEVANGEQVTGTSFQPPASFAENTTYYVRVVPYNAAGSAAGCAETSFTTEASKNISKTRYGISPNGDGINDLWIIEGIEQYPDNVVAIYNRWGDMVFQMRQYDNQSAVFTGVANRLTRLGAGALPSGTYFFNIRYNDDQGVNTVDGFLVLRR